MTGPEISRVIEQFITEGENEYCEERPHQEKGSASQLRDEVGKDLVTLDNKVF